MNKEFWKAVEQHATTRPNGQKMIYLETLKELLKIYEKGGVKNG